MIDYSVVITSITVAVGDVIAGGLILIGGYVGYLGIEKVLALFSGVKASAQERKRKVAAANSDFLRAKRDLEKAKRDNSVFSALFGGSSSGGSGGSGNFNNKRNYKKRPSRSFSISFGNFTFSNNSGSGSSNRDSYQRYSGNRFSSYKKGGNQKRNGYQKYSGNRFSSSNRGGSNNEYYGYSGNSSSPPMNDNFGTPPPPMDDSFIPPPDERFGPY